MAHKSQIQSDPRKAKGGAIYSLLQKGAEKWETGLGDGLGRPVGQRAQAGVRPEGRPRPAGRPTGAGGCPAWGPAGSGGGPALWLALAGWEAGRRRGVAGPAGRPAGAVG